MEENLVQRIKKVRKKVPKTIRDGANLAEQITEFSSTLKKEYGKTIEETIIYKALTKGVYKGKQMSESHEAYLKIEEFIEKLEEKYHL